MFEKISSTVWGLIIGISFIVGSVIVTGQAGSFWNLPSVFITIGGTFSAVIIAFPPKRLKMLIPVIKKAMIKENYDVAEDIEAILAMSEIARKEGLLALEDKVNELTKDDFLKKGIMLMVDGTEPDTLREFLSGENYFMQQRHQKCAAMLDMIAATAPALGLLGTYVGLIPMLNSLEDPTTLGPMMALELVSSFYGAFIAYVVFSPLAKRLKIMNGEEALRKEILIEGITSLQQGKNPRLIKDELCAYAHINSLRFEEKYNIQEREEKI